MTQLATITSPIFGASKDTADFALKVALVVGFALLTALAAQASIYLPGTPVPITLQTLTVTLAALTLGPRLGAVSMALYITLALVGLPVLAEAKSGYQIVIGATGGYLLGFILAQPVIAYAARNGKAFGGAKGLIASMVLGYAVIFACGVLWLALRMNLSFPEALKQGFWPFLPGTIVKSLAAFMVGFAVTPWAIKRGW